MIEADRADHSRAKLDHDLIVPITTLVHLLHTVVLEYSWLSRTLIVKINERILQSKRLWGIEKVEFC